MHRAATALLAALLLAGTAGGCGRSSDDAKSEAKPSRKATVAPQKLEPVWGPKITAAGGEDAAATSACQLPSSNACARYVRDIMAVVSGLEAAIKRSGHEYPKATSQIGKMKDAESEYVANGCQGDPTADDPNSQCHGVVAITIGTLTLDMTLTTDEFAL
ncbi:hypothetical protein ACFWBM_23305 [Streptomyces sp. NPDC059980]|uniref:hypothetical protein n=1 Tax=Streptomyces sp. NPDC059980 TaxID=3347022 RepID=UPI0036892394